MVGFAYANDSVPINMRSPRHLLVFLLTSSASLSALPTQAQINPDQTLGPEQSIVTPDIEVRGEPADLIEGGAIRGPNLFHSFSEFNIPEAGRAYFANPVGIESILSRVTGSSLSDIFGTLGVDGTADLFLVNPNGIVFGPNVDLDIEGSFYATTAEAVSLGEGIFSAVAPDQSQLLMVKPSASFFSYLTPSSGDIVNRGQVIAGDNLLLSANNLDLRGQVAAGGDLSLLAADTIQIRDAAETPFVAYSGGDLLVQGNQQVDIVALTHPNSGLFSGGDMVLRSPREIGGDAHYWSGGNFSIENLTGQPGSLFSPIDPIIRALGDVDIEAYQGSSLHILAGGSVRISVATITMVEAGVLGTDFLRETIQLSDGTLVDIDGAAEPTLDVRAGVSPTALGMSPGFPTGLDAVTDTLTSRVAAATPSSANIFVGDIFITAPSGKVLLTNQYFPNLQLGEGNILIESEFAAISGVNGIFAGIEGGGGQVSLDARNDISLIDSVITTLSVSEPGRDIVLLAGEDIQFSSPLGRFTGAITGAPPSAQSAGGNIRVTAANLDLSGGAQINASTIGPVDAGDIIVKVSETASFDGVSATNVATGVVSAVRPGAQGNGGNVILSARNLEVINGASLTTSTSGDGDAGNIILTINELARFDGVNPVTGLSSSGASSSIEPDGKGSGGNVELIATNLEVTNGAALTASTFGQGDAGNVILRIDETARFDGVNPTTGLNPSGAFSSVELGGKGAGGNVDLDATNLEVTNGAALTASTFGQGDAGNVILRIDETARFDGVNPTTGLNPSGAFSSVELGGKGAGGNVDLDATNLEVTNGAALIASTSGEGDAGNVILRIDETARFDGVNSITGLSPSGAFSSVNPQSEGKGGNVELTAANLEVTNGAALSASTFGEGDAGNVILRINETARFDGVNPATGIGPSGVFSSVELGGKGDGGNVELTAGNVEVTNGAALTASTLGEGNAGNINLTVFDQIRIDNGTVSTTSRTGSGGQVDIRAGGIILRNDGDIQTAVESGKGSGGNITIISSYTIALEDSDILAFSTDGIGGAIDLSQTTLFSQNLSLSSENLTREELEALDINSRVDINATGGIEPGAISINDASFVENNLTELANTLFNSDTLVATSCLSFNEGKGRTLIFANSDRLPQAPTEAPLNPYPTGTVQPTLSSAAEPVTITEPQAVYRLTDGRLVISRDCES